METPKKILLTGHEEIDIKLTSKEVNIINGALMELPAKISMPIIKKITDQFTSQIKKSESGRKSSKNKP